MNSNSEMPFLQHLEELRNCIAKSLLGIIISAIVAFVWASSVFAFLTAPLMNAFDNVELIGTGPADAFMVKLKVSLFAGILISCPYTFYHTWRFIAPALHGHEKRFALPFVVATSLFFILGTAFCFYVVFPFAFQFFLGEFSSIGVNASIRISEYLSFCVKLLLVFGLLFEMPVLSYFLAKLGLLTSKTLITKSRYAIVIIFIVAAILTPPDVITQILLAIPLLLLYGLCILITKHVEKAALV